LQKCFCRETNFSFRQVITEGKVVLFRGAALDRSTRRLLAVCLKMDFQTWARRRSGGNEARFGLNREGGKRTILFVCDEYQEYVTGGADGDEEFYGVSRSSRVCAIVATQHVTSLHNALGNEDQTTTLMNNLCTKVFLNTPDEKTGALGEHLGAKAEIEKLREKVDDSTVLGKGGGGAGTTDVDKELRENFRKDRFANLLTIDMEKSAKPPWYSEAFVYHYNSFEKGPTKMFETRLMHCYAPRDYMSEASIAYDVILRDRNAQRVVSGAYLGLMAHAEVLHETRKEDFAKNMARAEVELFAARKLVTLERKEITPEEEFAMYNEEIARLESELPRLSGEAANSCRLRLEDLLTRRTIASFPLIVKKTPHTVTAESDLSAIMGLGAMVAAAGDASNRVVAGASKIEVVESGGDIPSDVGVPRAQDYADAPEGRPVDGAGVAESAEGDELVDESECRGLSIYAERVAEEAREHLKAMGGDNSRVEPKPESEPETEPAGPPLEDVFTYEVEEKEEVKQSSVPV